MTHDCTSVPAVHAQTLQDGLLLELVSADCIPVDDGQPEAIYEKAAYLRVTNQSRGALTVRHNAGAAAHLAFGVASFAPVLRPDREEVPNFGPLDPSRVRTEKAKLGPGDTLELRGRSSYVLRLTDAARRDAPELGQRRNGSWVTAYRVRYQYNFTLNGTKTIRGDFLRDLEIRVP
ncbi:hypothetical protein JMK10_01015 [Rhodovulum sulfidophilum]|uniref:hypothetical protein n=1 Tax=Rhodovulum sulfidophilum TaxID=35806 RepID=UPI0019239A30|nr:hypothetical protein [Rhodovulum sulfidophilum]MBL3574751.1 hypothetical protein [Rhodovulum sulfidophilum]MCE8431853.1 hypothetical protein [Rhodovulum sulfidophilum]MCF4115440.1 hypothetical protein [Rhodovulum sulfidophilum]